MSQDCLAHAWGCAENEHAGFKAEKLLLNAVLECSNERNPKIIFSQVDMAFQVAGLR
ncbi:hypothetical protein [Ruegeria sp. HKCCA4008]|uniref:hypothetical protein n=1 Tax=Ruegeria sp. HKCCA4008 TaxID=2682999 RepID=UPI0014895701|nr:hypothetical protein [Ruegeria sp. HKCCA4008]